MCEIEKTSTLNAQKKFCTDCVVTVLTLIGKIQCKPSGIHVQVIKAILAFFSFRQALRPAVLFQHERCLLCDEDKLSQSDMSNVRRVLRPLKSTSSNVGGDVVMTTAQRQGHEIRGRDVTEKMRSVLLPLLHAQLLCEDERRIVGNRPQLRRSHSENVDLEMPHGWNNKFPALLGNQMMTRRG